MIAIHKQIRRLHTLKNRLKKYFSPTFNVNSCCCLAFANQIFFCLQNRDRDHMSRHFLEELTAMVKAMPVRTCCNLCDYKHPKNENMCKHLALFHCKLDELLQDEELLNRKRRKFVNRPKRVNIGDSCVICNMSVVSREHVSCHFKQELLAIVNTFESPLSCGECDFTAAKSEYVARHLGLDHFKLDEFLSDPEIVAKKQQVCVFKSNTTIPVIRLSHTQVEKEMNKLLENNK